MSDLEFKGFPISEGKVEGEVLISEDPINFYIVKPETGILFEKDHDLEGKSIAGKILVFPSDKKPQDCIVLVVFIWRLMMDLNQRQTD